MLKETEAKARVYKAAVDQLAGEILDARTAAALFGGTERLWYSRAARGIVPFRKWGGRLVFLRSELESFFAETLPGVTLAEAKANIAARGWME